MYYEGYCVDLIEINYIPEYDAYYLYIDGELYDTSHDDSFLRLLVENHDTGCSIWDDSNEMPVWVSSGKD